MTRHPCPRAEHPPCPAAAGRQGGRRTEFVLILPRRSIKAQKARKRPPEATSVQRDSGHLKQ
jgi:hypothetical protein